MTLFHTHRWMVVRRTFTPPASNLTSARGYDSDLIMSVLYGMTVVESRCDCGAVSFAQAPGDQT